MCSEISNGTTLFSQELQQSLSSLVLQQNWTKKGLAVFSIEPNFFLLYLILVVVVVLVYFSTRYSTSENKSSKSYSANLFR